MRISPEYLAMNKQMHDDMALYGTSGGRWVSDVKRFCKTNNTYDLLDYGCGKGQLNKYLPFDIAEYDPAIPGKDAEPEPHDLVFCADVLEHIEPECLADVLDHLHGLMKVGGLLCICLEESKKPLPDGRNSHLIVQPSWWWKDRLRVDFHICAETLLAIYPDYSGPAKKTDRPGNHIALIVKPK